MKKISVLGAGLVGRAIAADLARKHQVRSVDISGKNLDLIKDKKIEKKVADVSDASLLNDCIADADLVIGAVPGFMGFEMLKNVILAKKPIVDISFFPEDPFLLDDLAKENNVIAIMDCGVAPGMDNVILGYHAQQMQVEEFVCYVGGLPKEKAYPYEYKAPFSPIDVLEEYTRPARYVEGGKTVEMPALSEPEIIDFPVVGALEAFNTDGLRSLIKTMKGIPNMKEKTLRYKGHIDLMRAMRETGLLSEKEIEVKGQKIKPIDLTSKLLFPLWELKDKDEEFTIMQVIVKGKENGQAVKYIYDLYDEYDVKSGVHSMARTTGYTCTAAANMVLEGLYQKVGISPPEYLGYEASHFEFMLDYLKQRNVIYKKTIQK